MSNKNSIKQKNQLNSNSIPKNQILGQPEKNTTENSEIEKIPEKNIKDEKNPTINNPEIKAKENATDKVEIKKDTSTSVKKE